MKNMKSKLVDILFLCMTVLPFAAGIVLRVLFRPLTEGVTVTGAQIYFTVPMPIQDLPVTEAQVNSLLVVLSLTGLCLFLTHGVTKIPHSRRQLLAEMLVEKVQELTDSNMGPRFSGFAPFVAAILALSAFSSLSSMLGLFSPTSDLNIVAGWALLVFILITYYKTRGGIGNYLREFTKPVVVLTPVNIIGEVATPLSMTLRHYGNILSGMVISTMLSVGLSGLSRLIFGWLPGAFGQFPFFEIGIPAVFSIYFDIFSGCLQAFIFAMLTMIYISNGFPGEAYEARMKRKSERIARRKQRQAEKTGVA